MAPELALTLATAAARRDGPVFYLDTNILVDIVRRRRNPSSLDFIEGCLARSWRRLTSTFALMEALDVEQMNRWAKIETRKGESFDQLVSRRGERTLRPRVFREVYSKVMENLYDVVDQFELESDVWEEAIRIAVHTASFAADCIHVAAAKSRNCDVLVTRDTQLKKTSADEICVATPVDVLQALQATNL